MKKKLSLTAIVFFVFLALCAVAMAVLPSKGYSEKEKRFLNEFPAVTAKGIADGSVQQGLEDWFADRFPFRDLWVGLNAYLQLAEGRNAQRDVYLASEGYLINDPETCDQALFAKNLQKFEAFAQKTGLPASMVLVPTAGSMNEDKLPLGHGEYHDEALFQLAQETLSTVPLIDPRETLDGSLYYRTDHHLTARGCYELYKLWRTERGRSCLPEDAFTVTTEPGFCGTTWSASGYWLTEPDDIELWDAGAKVHVTITDSATDVREHDSLFFPEHLAELDKYPVYLDGNHALVKIENPAAEEGTLLIVKDSFAHCTATFLANHYKTIYMLDLRYYRGSVSKLITDNGVEELLYLYGVDTLLTDSNSGWLI